MPPETEEQEGVFLPGQRGDKDRAPSCFFSSARWPGDSRGPPLVWLSSISQPAPSCGAYLPLPTSLSSCSQGQKMFTTVASVCLPAGFASPIRGWEWQGWHSAYSRNEQCKHVNSSRAPKEVRTSHSGSVLRRSRLNRKQARGTGWSFTHVWAKSVYALLGSVKQEIRENSQYSNNNKDGLSLYRCWCWRWKSWSERRASCQPCGSHV